MKLSELFNIKIGTSLDLNKLEPDEKGINFVSRTGKNNGVSAKVKMFKDIKPLPAGCITIPTVGSVLSCFVQYRKFYSSQNVFYAVPKKEMSLVEKLYYCECLKENKFKYNYGRPADRTLKDIELPEKIPEWVYTLDTDVIDKEVEKELSYVPDENPLLPKNSKLFKVTDLFDIEKGKGPSLREAKENPGDVPFITATEKNNGASCYTSIPATHKGNCLTIACNGSIGCTFYQDKPFCGTSDIHVLKPKFKLTEHRAMFLIPIFEAHKFKYNYGRKWNLERMRDTTIMLPVKDNEVDWEYIDTLVKGLVE